MATTVTTQTPSRELGSSPLQGSINKMSDVFPTPPKAADVQLSPPPKNIHDLKRAASTPPETTNEKYLRSSDKVRGGDSPSSSHPATAWDRQQLSKKRSQYYGEIFAYREPRNTAKDRVARDSVIVANIRLNCKVRGLQNLSMVVILNCCSWRRSTHFCPTSHFSCPRYINAQNHALWFR